MLFSVLIANYNNAPFLTEAINSIINQTYTNWEIIIVDDNSSDNSIQVINKFISNNVNIKLFEHINNEGVGATKNDCCKLANGDVIGFLDPDDTLKEDALELMINEHKNRPEVSLVYSSLFYCDKNLKIKSKANWIKKIPIDKTNLHVNVISHFSSFKRKNYLETSGIERSLLSAADKDLYYKIEETGPTFFINLPLYYYRENEKGVSQYSNKERALTNHLLVYENAIRRRKISGFKNVNIIDHKKFKSKIYLNKGSLYRNQKIKALVFILLSFFYWPFSNNLNRLSLIKLLLK